MKRFAELYAVLDESTSTTHKVQAMVQYFRTAPAEDAAWAAYFLSGGKPRRTVPTTVLRQAALALSGTPDWLFEECYQSVGDLAETIALLIPDSGSLNEPDHNSKAPSPGLAKWMEQRILPLRNLPEEERLSRVMDCWRRADRVERFLFVKLVGGGFRVGVSKQLLIRALAESAGLDAKLVATRLMGYSDSKNTPDAAQYLALVQAEGGVEQGGANPLRPGHPFPFFLAHPLTDAPSSLGPVSDWIVEWKYDGIRAQIVKDEGRVWLWSRGEELITEQFPDLLEACAYLPDGCTLDGEILVWKQGAPAGFQALQTRLNRKLVSKKLCAEFPVVFMAYDLLRLHHEALTQHTQSKRRVRLDALVQDFKSLAPPAFSERILLSESIQSGSWSELEMLRQSSRARGVEGFMLKHRDSRYGVGRSKVGGVWWKWKIEPMTVDCVLVYAQRGHGRRASLYTDYTFAVWDRSPHDATELEAVLQAIQSGEKIDSTRARGLPALIPFAKAYSGLSDEEFRRVDAEIRKHTLEKFGPVRTVKPSLVFELGFEAIARSARHKSGVAVRFPRMLRIRDDKPLIEADTLSQLEALLLS